MKRVITPHKGGRDKIFSQVRLSVDELAAVMAMIKETGLSKSDWLAAAAKHKDRINQIILEG